MLSLRVTSVKTDINLLEAELHKRLISSLLFLGAQATKELTDKLYALPEPPEKKRKRTGNLRASQVIQWPGKGKSQPTYISPPPEPVPKGLSPEEKKAWKEKQAAKANDDKQDYLQWYEGFLDRVSQECRQEGWKSIYAIGYGAYYAVFVHEWEGLHWLTTALHNNKSKLVSIIEKGRIG